MQPPSLGQTIAVPDGPTSTVTTTREVSLSDPDDPLSLTSSTERVTVNGQEFETSFDAASRTFTRTTPEDRQTVTTVDAQGRPLSTEVTGVLPVVREYDEQGRLKTITQGSGDAARVTTFSYRDTEDNTNGYLDYIEDALGRRTTFDAYDDAGRVKQETLPGNRGISFDYDENGNLTSLTPPGKPAHLFEYTAVDLLEHYVGRLWSPWYLHPRQPQPR